MIAYDDINPVQQKCYAHHLKVIAQTKDQHSEERIANRLRKQRDHLFTFLYNSKVVATNNLAEQQLRLAVIARKLSCGNKTREGTDTWHIMSSLIVTNSQNGINNIEYSGKNPIIRRY